MDLIVFGKCDTSAGTIRMTCCRDVSGLCSLAYFNPLDIFPWHTCWCFCRQDLGASCTQEAWFGMPLCRSRTYSSWERSWHLKLCQLVSIDSCRGSSQCRQRSIFHRWVHSWEQLDRLIMLLQTWHSIKSRTRDSFQVLLVMDSASSPASVSWLSGFGIPCVERWCTINQYRTNNVIFARLFDPSLFCR